MTEETPKLDKILPAVAKAMASVKAIAKTGKNTHDRYEFASIDDFLAALNPICAEAGLIVHMNESGNEEFTRRGRNGETAWIKVEFTITVYHTSGQTLPPVKRSVEVIRSGAQAYGSAQSYALKQFLRSLLLVPTGDQDDADYGEKAEGPVGNGSRQNQSREPRPNTTQPSPMAIEAAIERLMQAPDMTTLQQEWTALNKLQPAIAALAEVQAAKDVRKDQLSAPQDAPQPNGHAPTHNLQPDDCPF